MFEEEAIRKEEEEERKRLEEREKNIEYLKKIVKNIQCNNTNNIYSEIAKMMIIIENL